MLLSATSNGVGVIVRLVGYGLSISRYQGIYTHTVTTTEVSPDFGKYSEIIDDVNVEMIPLRYH